MKSEKGFTLFEMIFVMLVLCAIVFASLMSMVSASSNYSKVLTTTKHLLNSHEPYKNDILVNGISIALNKDGSVARLYNVDYPLCDYLMKARHSSGLKFKIEGFSPDEEKSCKGMTSGTLTASTDVVYSPDPPESTVQNYVKNKRSFNTTGGF